MKESNDDQARTAGIEALAAAIGGRVEYLSTMSGQSVAIHVGKFVLPVTPQAAYDRLREHFAGEQSEEMAAFKADIQRQYVEALEETHLNHTTRHMLEENRIEELEDQLEAAKADKTELEEQCDYWLQQTLSASKVPATDDDGRAQHRIGAGWASSIMLDAMTADPKACRTPYEDWDADLRIEVSERFNDGYTEAYLGLTAAAKPEPRRPRTNAAVMAIIEEAGFEGLSDDPVKFARQVASLIYPADRPDDQEGGAA